MTTPTRVKGGKGAIVPEGEVRSYYGQPIIKEPVWTWEIPWYFFTGGLAGASSVLAARARRGGHDDLARVARRAALAGAVVSPVLLISDLGKPTRFYNMLRVFRPTSPMNMGSWLLSVYAPAAVVAAGLAEAGRLPRLQRFAEGVAALIGPVVTTYTGVLFADTAVPVWHEARRELPFLFAAGAGASAGAVAVTALPPEAARPARRLAILGGVGELLTMKVMENNLGPLAEPYEREEGGRFAKMAKVLTGTGVAMLGLFGRRRAGAVAGGLALAGGAAAERWAVFRAGFQSARDPKYTLMAQGVERRG